MHGAPLIQDLLWLVEFTVECSPADIVAMELALLLRFCIFFVGLLLGLCVGSGHFRVIVGRGRDCPGGGPVPVDDFDVVGDIGGSGDNVRSGVDDIDDVPLNDLRRWDARHRKLLLFVKSGRVDQNDRIYKSSKCSGMKTPITLKPCNTCFKLE